MSSEDNRRAEKQLEESMGALDEPAEIKRCSAERLAEIMKACDLKAWNEEFWNPELAFYATKHPVVLQTLKLGTRYHLKNGFDPENLPYPSLLSNSYDCVHHQKGEDFYKMFKNEVRCYVKWDMLSIFRNAERGNFLAVFSSNWHEYNVNVRRLGLVFSHLDNWAKSRYGNKYDDIKNLAMKAFRDNVLLNPVLKKVLIEALLKAIDEREKGKLADPEPLENVCKMLKNIQFEEKPSLYEPFCK